MLVRHTVTVLVVMKWSELMIAVVVVIVAKWQPHVA